MLEELNWGTLESRMARFQLRYVHKMLSNQVVRNPKYRNYGLYCFFLYDMADLFSYFTDQSGGLQLTARLGLKLMA